MIQYEAKKIKNIVLAGHGGCGKTSVAEAMLYLSGGSERLGKVDDGNTVFDFDAEEILARFVRGDESRSTEGNGLGLAIAKSYAEACRGSFDVTIDGDLFKATISFDKA